jgi:hypothetical protein
MYYSSLIVEPKYFTYSLWEIAQSCTFTYKDLQDTKQRKRPTRKKLSKKLIYLNKKLKQGILLQRKN